MLIESYHPDTAAEFSGLPQENFKHVDGTQSDSMSKSHTPTLARDQQTNFSRPEGLKGRTSSLWPPLNLQGSN